MDGQGLLRVLPAECRLPLSLADLGKYGQRAALEQPEAGLSGQGERTLDMRDGRIVFSQRRHCFREADKGLRLSLADSGTLFQRLLMQGRVERGRRPADPRRRSRAG